MFVKKIFVRRKFWFSRRKSFIVLLYFPYLVTSFTSFCLHYKSILNIFFNKTSFRALLKPLALFRCGTTVVNKHHWNIFLMRNFLSDKSLKASTWTKIIQFFFEKKTNHLWLTEMIRFYGVLYLQTKKKIIYPKNNWREKMRNKNDWRNLFFFW